MIDRFIALSLVLMSVAACAPPAVKDVLSSKSAVELRAMQSRNFDTADQNKTLRTIVATLQDTGYTVTKVEPPAGTVSATKVDLLRMTATVFRHGDKQVTVRANAMIRMPELLQNDQVDDPKFYQTLFFEPLSKAMFLTALQVDDSGPDTPAKPSDETKQSSTAAATLAAAH